VAHRLQVAGRDGAALFSGAALARLYRASGGVPRLVNILAHKALMLCYGEGKQQVAGAHVQAAARDTLSTGQAGRGRAWPWLTALGAAAACLAGGMAWAFIR